MMLTAPEIVARRENRPPNLSKKTGVVIPAAPKFQDTEHWNGLAATYLSRYDLPGWDVPCNPEAMARWLDRLDLAECDFLRTGDYQSAQDFIALNPDWPLRAFIGLATEIRNEGGHDDAG
jgi:hypothetical protein